jgi:hypothetical protein
MDRPAPSSERAPDDWQKVVFSTLAKIWSRTPGSGRHQDGRSHGQLYSDLDQYHPTNAPHSPSPTCCSYLNDKQARFWKAAFVRTSEGTVPYSTYIHMLSEVFIHTMAYHTLRHCLPEALLLGVRRPEPKAALSFQSHSEVANKWSSMSPHHTCSSRGA